MLVEELLELPVGTQVVGALQVTKTVPGVVESMKHGPHFIRWADGYVTFPFGWIRDCDEYIAARTEANPVDLHCFTLDLTVTKRQMDRQ